MLAGKAVATILLLSFASMAAGQRAASIEGDVYLLMKSGDTKKASGRTVYLLRTDKNVEASIGAACETVRDALVRADERFIMADSAYRAGMRTNASSQALSGLFDERLLAEGGRPGALAAFATTLQREIGRAKVDSTGTGMNAHYRFRSVRPGRYILYTGWKIGDNSYEWWTAVTVKAGEKVTRDLDNDVAGVALLDRCR